MISPSVHQTIRVTKPVRGILEFQCFLLTRSPRQSSGSEKGDNFCANHLFRMLKSKIFPFPLHLTNAPLRFAPTRLNKLHNSKVSLPIAVDQQVTSNNSIKRCLVRFEKVVNASQFFQRPRNINIQQTSLSCTWLVDHAVDPRLRKCNSGPRINQMINRIRL
jgi:hypothetical protein